MNGQVAADKSHTRICVDQVAYNIFFGFSPICHARVLNVLLQDANKADGDTRVAANANVFGADEMI